MNSHLKYDLIVFPSTPIRRIVRATRKHSPHSPSAQTMSCPQGDIRKAITPGSTYAAQSSLPRLPIPTLEETLERFPAVVTAILKKEDMKICLEEIRTFLETDGPVLQQLLIDYEQRGWEEGRLGSFVEEFWTDAYLTPDSSVVMNLNPFFVLEVCSHS